MARFEPLVHELPGEMHMRAAASTYVLFTIVFGAGMLVPLLVSGLHDVSAWKVTALFGGALAVFLIHFSRLEVRLSNGIITYRTLFVLRRSCRIDDIVESWIGRNPGSRDTRPMLFIKTREGARLLAINLKPYRPEDVRRLVNMPELKLRHSHEVA